MIARDPGPRVAEVQEQAAYIRVERKSWRKFSIYVSIPGTRSYIGTRERHASMEAALERAHELRDLLNAAVA